MDHFTATLPGQPKSENFILNGLWEQNFNFGVFKLFFVCWTNSCWAKVGFFHEQYTEYILMFNENDDHMICKWQWVK